MEQSNILDILRSKSTVFSFTEILLLSKGISSQWLRRRLHYYVTKGELYPIRRGLYAKDQNYDRRELGTKIFTPAYVSFETILAEAGVIFQYYETIFVATYQTRSIECDGNKYSFHKLKGPLLTSGIGVENRGNFHAATPERAFLDILYLNKSYHFDNLGPLSREKVYEILPLYNNKRMTRKVNEYFAAFDAQ